MGNNMNGMGKSEREQRWEETQEILEELTEGFEENLELNAADEYAFRAQDLMQRREGLAYG